VPNGVRDFEALTFVGDYYPRELRAEIGGINSHIYANLNNGVYEAGFAASQAAYHTAVDRVFDTLEWLPVTTALSVR
jgi:glutathionyl-hydroquinone reductase